MHSIQRQNFMLTIVPIYEGSAAASEPLRFELLRPAFYRDSRLLNPQRTPRNFELCKCAGGDGQVDDNFKFSVHGLALTSLFSGS